jgi:hypothetical protein
MGGQIGGMQTRIRKGALKKRHAHFSHKRLC